MSAKVFVSHSAKSDDDRALLDRIVAKLAEEGLKPWVDHERLKVGNNWSQEITKQLQDCHAAVILFSKAALDSHFVKYEVSVLDHRKRSQVSFGLFPVIIDDTAVEAFHEDFYGAIRLNDFQFGRLADKEDEVFAALKQIDPEDTKPTSAIEGALMQIFRQVAPEVLRKAAGDLKWPTWDQVGVADAEALSFVRQLLSAPLITQIRALRKIVEDLPPGHGFDRVFRRVAPWWVNERAARGLKAVQIAAPGRRCAVLNGKQGAWTCEMFLRRAEPSQDVSMILGAIGAGAPTVPGAPAPALGPGRAGDSPLIGGVMPVGRRTADDLVIQVLRNLCARYQLQPRETPKQLDEEIERAIKEGEDVDFYPIQVIHLDEHGLPALGKLLDRFGRLTLIVMTGETMPQVPAGLAGRVTAIEPELNHDEQTARHSEAYAFKWVSKKNDLLGAGNG